VCICSFAGKCECGDGCCGDDLAEPDQVANSATVTSALTVKGVSSCCSSVPKATFKGDSSCYSSVPKDVKGKSRIGIEELLNASELSQNIPSSSGCCGKSKEVLNSAPEVKVQSVSPKLTDADEVLNTPDSASSK
jgi:hypothetical protein